MDNGSLSAAPTPVPSVQSTEEPSGGSGPDPDRIFAEMAVEEALKSVPEDGRAHPKVGAVVVKNGELLGKAHRGESPKSHAEYIALDDKLSDELVAGATVYTTLEPCTTRKHPKIPCARRLIDRKVARVVIGMLDPNPEIRGLGDQLLSDAGIEVQLFPRDLRAKVEEMNRDFIRAQKSKARAIAVNGLAHESEYWEQRKKLPETDVLRRIWSKPRWRIWIRPTQYRKARFPSVQQCRDFIVSSYVQVRGWFPYPWFAAESLERSEESISGEIDWSERGARRLERWSLLRSGQFVHNRAFDEIPQLGERVHVLEVLDSATGAFELAARMAQQGFATEEIAIRFEMFGVAGRRLTWPQDLLGDTDAVARNAWCQDEEFAVERIVAADDLQSRSQELALDVALEIYSRFGWADPPEERLRLEQKRRFGEG